MIRLFDVKGDHPMVFKASRMPDHHHHLTESSNGCTSSPSKKIKLSGGQAIQTEPSSPSSTRRQTWRSRVGCRRKWSHPGSPARTKEDSGGQTAKGTGILTRGTRCQPREDSWPSMSASSPGRSCSENCNKNLLDLNIQHSRLGRKKGEDHPVLGKAGSEVNHLEIQSEAGMRRPLSPPPPWGGSCKGCRMTPPVPRSSSPSLLEGDHLLLEGGSKWGTEGTPALSSSSATPPPKTRSYPATGLQCSGAPGSSSLLEPPLQLEGGSKWGAARAPALPPSSSYLAPPPPRGGSCPERGMQYLEHLKQERSTN